MKKQVFLQQSGPFVRYLAAVIEGSVPLGFKRRGGVDRFLRDALDRYAWPREAIKVVTPLRQLTLPARAGYTANERVLKELATGIRKALHAPVNEKDLIHWAKAIMQWGGVYTSSRTGKGNKGWLESWKGKSFSEYLTRAITALKMDDDFTQRQLRDLRSNAGTTKIHSLLLRNFVIYDSRVAGAIAWLVLRWAKESKNVPEHLRFACMRGKTSKKEAKVRSPNRAVFPIFSPSGPVSKHHRHAMWNLRANWLIEAALELARKKDSARRWSPREVEAALFMMGEDLSRAL